MVDSGASKLHLLCIFTDCMPKNRKFTVVTRSVADTRIDFAQGLFLLVSVHRKREIGGKSKCLQLTCGDPVGNAAQRVESLEKRIRWWRRRELALVTGNVGWFRAV